MTPAQARRATAKEDAVNPPTANKRLVEWVNEVAEITTPDRVSRMAFDVELADPTHLQSLVSSLKYLDGVFDAYRQLPGKRP